MSYQYLPNGEVSRVVNGLGHVTEHAYDALNRRIRTLERGVLQPDGSLVDLVIESHYDQRGNLVRQVDARGVAVRSTYDALNRLTQTRVIGGPSPTVVGRGNIIADYAYDLVGNKVFEIDLNGDRTDYRYDSLYRLTQTLLPFINTFADTPSGLGRATTEMQYDLVNNVTRRTDANGNATTYAYDRIYRLKLETDAVNNSRHYLYDRASNLVRETRKSGSVTTSVVTYDNGIEIADGLGRPSTITETVYRGDPSAAPADLYTTSFLYDDAQNRVIITNARGFETEHLRDGLDRVHKIIVDPDGLRLKTTYTYDANGNLVTISDPQNGDVDVSYTYDGLGRAIRADYLLGLFETWVYDGGGNVVQYVDKRGITFTGEFDNLSRPTAEKVRENISNGGQVLALTRHAYDDVHNLVVTRDAKGISTTVHRDGMDRVSLTKDAAGETVEMFYDGVNRRAVVDKLGRRTEFFFDALNRLVRTEESDADGVVRTITRTRYEDAGNRVIETDRRGVETIHQLDSRGRLVEIRRSHPDLLGLYGSTEILLERAEYDGNNNKILSVDATGNQTRFMYDAADRKTALTEGFGSAVAATSVFAYDKVGNLLTMKDGRAHGGAFDFQYSYDARYRMTAESNAEGQTATYTYDGNDNLLTMAEPLGGNRLTRYAYDEVGALLSVDQTRGAGGGGVTFFRYDANRNRIAQQDASGNLVTYAYDSLNRLTDTFQHLSVGSIDAATPRTGNFGGSAANALHWHNAYDANGNQTLAVDANGQRVQMAHDHLDRLASATFSNHLNATLDSQVWAIDYVYDGNGNVIGRTETKRVGGADVVQQYIFTYDPLNRPTRIVNYDGKQVRYAYDLQGNRKSITDPDNRTTTYTFDARNRVATAVTESGTTTYDYYADGLMRSIGHANGTVSDYSYSDAYDRADRLKRVVHHTGNVGDAPTAANLISAFTYVYDDNGNRTSQTEAHRAINAGAPETTTYSYDLLNRLTRVLYGASGINGRTDYTYDRNGNRTSEAGTDPGNPGRLINRSYHYDRLNRLRAVIDVVRPNESVAYDYDDNGNRVSRTVGQVTVVNDAGGNPVVMVIGPTQASAYEYGIRDELLRTSALAGGFVTFDYDANNMRIRKTGPSGETRYLYDGRATLVEYGSDLNTTVKYDYGYDLMSLVRVTTTGERDMQVYHYDGLGSASTLTDAAGAVVHRYMYDAWGDFREFNAAGIALTSGTSTNAKQYTGHYHDSETDLHYFGARYYDDATGAFISQDPYKGDINTPASLHRYTYAYGNPLYYVDLTGYSPEPRRRADTDYERISPLKITDEYRNLTKARTTGQQSGEFLAGYAVGIVESAWGAGESIAYLAADIFEHGTKSALATSLRDGSLFSEAVKGVTGTWGRIKDGWKATMDAADRGEFFTAGREFAKPVLEIVGVLDGAAGIGAVAGRVFQKSVKAIGQVVMPTLAVGQDATNVIQKVLRQENLVMGIRAVDPVTAMGTEAGRRLGLHAKVKEIKSKSTFGVGYDSKHGAYRGDLDIAYVMKQAEVNGKMKSVRMRDPEVLELMGRLNQALKDANLPPEFMHGSHFSALNLPSSGGPLKYARGDYSYKHDLGHPGAVAQLNGGGISMKSPWQVADFAVSHNLPFPKSWYGWGRAQVRDILTKSVGLRDLRGGAFLSQGESDGEQLRGAIVGDGTASAALDLLSGRDAFALGVTSWLAALRDVGGMQLSVIVEDLPGAQVGEARITRLNSRGLPAAGEIVLDLDAAGVGWFVDTTPGDASEFADPTSEAQNEYDLYTVFLHELGHLLGFDPDLARFSEHVQTVAGSKLFASDGVTATLSSDGDHLDDLAHRNALMNSLLAPGARRNITDVDAKIIAAVRGVKPANVPPGSGPPVTSPGATPNPTPTAPPTTRPAKPDPVRNAIPPTGGAPITSALANGDFSNSDPASAGFGWKLRGPAAIAAGAAVLGENDRLFAGLSQTFVIPAGAQKLHFRLLANFGPRGAGAPDAFEVALLNASTLAPVAGTSAGLTSTDSLLNIQSDGRTYFSGEVNIFGLATSGEILSLGDAIDVSIDVSGIASGTAVTLYFDLLGFGDPNSTVRIDDVTFDGQPFETSPVLTAPAGQSADEGVGKSFDLGSFIDAGLDDGPWSVRVDWGDGSAAATFTTTTQGALGNRSHTYADDGDYTVEITVTDKTDATGSAQFHAIIGGAAPLVTPPADQMAFEGASKTFDLGAFSDAGLADGPWNVAVDWGDGSDIAHFTMATQGALGSLSHTFADEDSYTVQVTVTDKDGQSGISQFTVDVSNAKPSVSAPADQDAVEGSPESIDLGSFADSGLSDGPWSVDVDWGDGSAHTTFAIGNVGSLGTRAHTFANNGQYTVTVRVTDKDGGANSAAFFVAVENAKPVVMASPGDQSGTEGTAALLDLGSFVDAGLSDGPWSVNVDWGDGSVHTVFAATAQGSLGTRFHTYVDSGPFTVTVTVTDIDGGTGMSQFVVPVANADPIVDSASDQAVSEGVAKDFNLGSFSDRSLSDGPWIVVVKWGDGSADTTFTTTAAGALSTKSHTYADDGTYAVTVSVTDKDGGSGTGSFDVLVANARPAVTAPSTQRASEGAATAFVLGSFADAPTDGPWIVQVNWGDGSTPTTFTTDTPGQLPTQDHRYADDGEFTVTVSVTDNDGAVGSAQFKASIANLKPAIAALSLSSRVVDEDGMLTVAGSFNDAGLGDTHTVVIYWGDGTSSLAHVDQGKRTFDASHRYEDDNPTTTSQDDYQITVIVTDDADDASNAASARVTVRNVAPSAALTAPSSGVRGQLLLLSAAFADIGALDTHEIAWDFGDGVSSGFRAVGSAADLASSHVYDATGTYTVTLRIRDDDGGVAIIARVVKINAVELQVDPCDSSKTALVVGGTSASDHIEFSRNGKNGIKVLINGVSQGVFVPTGHIIAHGQGGDDSIHLTGSIDLPSMLFGDAGNDSLNGGNGHNIQVGGDGDDKLIGGNDRDLLIGGAGLDQIVGNGGDDILVAFATAFDQQPHALCHIMEEWSRTDVSYQTRINHLQNGGGFNDQYLFTSNSILSDATQDMLTGSSGSDWFLLNKEDKLSGLAAGEVTTLFAPRKEGIKAASPVRP
jgi:RHS repeat-associated protein